MVFSPESSTFARAGDLSLECRICGISLKMDERARERENGERVREESERD